MEGKQFFRQQLLLNSWSVPSRLHNAHGKGARGVMGREKASQLALSCRVRYEDDWGRVRPGVVFSYIRT